MEINCEFYSPKTWENIAPDNKLDIWNYSEINCVASEPTTTFELIENSTTGASFFIDKIISYGDFLIITFLMIFLILGITGFLINFIIPKFFNFKR